MSGWDSEWVGQVSGRGSEWVEQVSGRVGGGRSVHPLCLLSSPHLQAAHPKPGGAT